MSLREIEQLFSEFDKMNVHIVRISGGEPFMRKDIREIIRSTEDYNFAVCINTNGTLLNDDDIRFIANSKIAKLGISLDAYSQELHEKIRGVSGSYDKTVQNIRNLVLNCRGKVSTTCTLTSDNCNVEVVERTIAFNKSLNVGTISFQLTSPVGRCADEREQVPTYQQWKEVFLWLTAFKKKDDSIKVLVNPTNEGSVYWEFFLPLKETNQLDLLSEVWEQDAERFERAEYISCVAGNVTAAISHNGDVYPCELMMGRQEMCIGNALLEGFQNLWNTSPLLGMIRNKKRAQLEEPCGTCEHEFCGGGCRAVGIACTQSLWGADERCPNAIQPRKEGLNNETA
jgi:radical SAM protein with 4Fe4S-binding SPASM domain